MFKNLISLFSTFIIVSIMSAAAQILPNVPKGAEALSLSGKPLFMDDPKNELILKNLSITRNRYMDYPMDPDRVIWYGRRLGYAGDFRQAIKIFTEGTLDFPRDPKFYRHREHRYITIREFDRAIIDLEKASVLINGKENSTEEDGVPNAAGLPVSTLHGNIFYHLGLSYYLIQDWENAKRVYDLDHSVARNDDNRVSIAHWRYMIRRRMGNTHDEAKYVLDEIHSDMNVLENYTYYRLCLFYKGVLSEDEISEGIDLEDSADAASAYGLANWYYYNDDEVKAKTMFKKMLNAKAWGSFGFIAAEADLAAME